MIANLIRVALRVFLRNRLYSAANVAGLALGLAACTVLLLYVHFESNYDGFHPHSERLFRVVSSDSLTTPMFLGTELKLVMPEIEAMVRITDPSGYHPTISSDKVQRHQRADLAEAGFFEIFEFAFLAGDPVTALDGPHRMVISAEMAQLYFGDADPIGRELRWDDTHSYTVTGVFHRRRDTHFDFHLVGSLATTRHWPFDTDQAATESAPVVTYLRLAPHTSAEGFFDRALQRLPDGRAKDHLVSSQMLGGLPRLQPVVDIYLHSDFTKEYRVPHFHVLLFDGVYVAAAEGAAPDFIPAPPLEDGDVQEIVETAAERIVRLLQRRGLLDDSQEDEPMNPASSWPTSPRPRCGHIASPGPVYYPEFLTLTAPSAPPVGAACTSSRRSPMRSRYGITSKASDCRRTAADRPTSTPASKRARTAAGSARRFERHGHLRS
jgi:hypothetical protein